MTIFRFINTALLLLFLYQITIAGSNISEETIDRRVDSLLHLMTLEEKIGQMNQFSGYIVITGPVQESGSRKDYFRRGMVGAMLNVVGVKAIREMQQAAVENTRLGIPLLFGLDVIHGYRTIFPIPLAESCSWDLEAIENSARIAAVEASASGLNWTFAPVVDISRNPRWGRIMEGAGEDPYLASRIAASRVQGFQGTDLTAPNTILACAKHFAAYGAVEAGREYNTVDMSLRRLHEIYLPPFKAAVDAGVATVMNAFNELNGIPASANQYLVETILRDTWGFKGFVFSDWGSYRELITHGVAANKYEAANLAIRAGGDMDMASLCYLEELPKLVADGQIDEHMINTAVHRILRMKFKSGLMDDPFLYCDEEREAEKILNPEHLEAARDMARKSMVLLKNEGNILPLKKDIASIAVIGPLADNQEDLNGPWSAMGKAEDVVSLLNGIGEKVSSGTKILFAEGSGIHEGSSEELEKAIETAMKADIVILAVGEAREMSGEAASRAFLGLPEAQEDLVRAIYKTDKPVVVTLMNGRPLTINWISEHIPAILECWFLGTQAGHAIADVLFGDYNPSGKLTVSFPYAVGQIPIYYNHKNTGRPYNGTRFTSHFIDIPNEPLYPFGHGLSYTTFSYSEIRLDSDALTPGGFITATVTVQNTGDLPGEEVVQMYIRDLVGSVTRPVKELKGFQKIALNPGEKKQVAFRIMEKDLAFYTKDMTYKAEPGEFRIYIGTSSEELKESGFTLLD